MIGQLIGGRYRITGILGEGGMGVVYVGEQQMGSTVRKVAVKTLHPHLSKDPSVLARFHRECGTVAQLEHPNTIKFYDFGATSDGTLYIAMEFVAGKPLSAVIETTGPLSSERTVKILRQICGALEEAHKLGIVHRDLKPDNVILTDRAGESDFVKVLDFGIAARTESKDQAQEQKLTQQGMVLGTPPYMSPEQFTGKALDKRSDIYSLGVMAYEMLTGRLPFEADTPWQWATQHMTAQPLPFEAATAAASTIPEGLRRGILRALSKNREDRQDSARQFFAELSEGNQLTAEQASRAATGTAAMGAAPNFQPVMGGVAPTAAMPPAGGPVAAQYAPQHMAHAVPPAPSSSGGGGKGLIFGLLGLGVVLLVAIAVIAARAFKRDDSGTAGAPPTNDSSGQAANSPQPTAVSANTAEIAANTAQLEAAAPSLELEDAGKSVTKPNKVKVVTTHEPPPEVKPPPGPTGEAACDACIAAAQAGSITAAAGNFNRCDNPAKKQRCRGVASSRAPGAVRAAAFQQKCAQAKALAAAARAMGAGGDFSSAMGSCK
jgi:serine/threonine-protein kinase